MNSPEHLVDILVRCPLFQDIPREHLERLKPELRSIQLAPGEVLFHEHDLVDALFCVDYGLLAITAMQEDQDGRPENDEILLNEVGPDSPVGERQILTGGRRSATVTAREPTHLARLSKAGFDQLLVGDPQVVRKLTNTIMPYLYRDQLVRVLPNLFGELKHNTLRDLESRMNWIHLRRGDKLIQQDDPSDRIFVIVSGRLRAVIMDENGQEHPGNEMVQGECVGEMGVFTNAPRSASVIACRDSEVIAFSKEDFHGFLKRYPPLLENVTRLIIERHRRSERSHASRRLSSNILLAPACSDAPLDEFALQFRRSLAAMADCLLLTSRSVDAALDAQGLAQAREGEPDDLRLRSWLNQQEDKYRFIIYQADAEVTPWTLRCIRQADEILYVARAEASAELTAVEGEVQRQEKLGNAQRRLGLVLLHSDGSRRPQNTRRWYVQRHLDRHWHVRTDTPADFDRLARFAAGRATGLVLSGGGARGFAHVGILRALREAGIPVDTIAGVSMGALIAAGYAFAEDFESMTERIKAQLDGVMSDRVVPVISLYNGGRFNASLKHLFGATRIEDLWFPFFCVSSNLTQASVMIHREGPIWECVRASGSLPGIVPPVIQNGDLLYDGCLVNNLPMDVMRREVDAGAVIAVDVVPPGDAKLKAACSGAPTGWQILRDRLMPWASKFKLPSALSVLYRAGELGTIYGRQRLINEGIADLYLEPPVKEFEIMDFSTVDETARRGYEYGKRKIDEWLASRK